MKHPVYVDKNGRQVELQQRLHGWVHFCAQGGGFVKKMPARIFDQNFSVAPAPAFKLGFVSADWLEGKPLACFLDGRKWNGWAMPYFPIASAIKAVGDQGSYDPARDAFVVTMEDLDEPEVYEGQLIEVDGARVKVYAIGAGGWCWDEADDPAVGEQYMGFPVARLQEVFKGVADPKGWKRPVRAIIEEKDFEITAAAVLFMAGSPLEITQKFNSGKVRVYGPGYYQCIGS